MTRRLPPHTLMVTFLNDKLKERQITIEHLADLLSPITEDRIRRWFNGYEAPEPSALAPIAEALRVSPVELTCGWLIDQLPSFEHHIREITLDPLASDFPRSSDMDLRAPVPARDMSVEDPFDAHAPGSHVEKPDFGPVRKVASGASKRGSPG